MPKDHGEEKAGKGSVQSRLNGLPEKLLAWYDRHARDLPWRIGPGMRAAGARVDPYRVWLSEIMLQQTTAPHAARYFAAFTERWPSVEALAGASDEEVMAAWAGLGYYARARNLLKCARQVASAGGFPVTETDLRALPGVGPYTAGAVAAIAFGQRAAAVDGNVDRVFSRLLALKGPWAEEKKRIAETVRALVPEARPGEFAEALMDLGATVCTPKSPNCLICPLSQFCSARIEGEPARYPVKPAKAAKPLRRGVAYVLVHRGAVLLERRPARGLLGGMLGLPTTDWVEAGEPVDRPPASASWIEAGSVRHVFTHFALDLSVRFGRRPDGSLDGLWTPVEAVEGLPSVFEKAFRLGIAIRASTE